MESPADNGSAAEGGTSSRDRDSEEDAYEPSESRSKSFLAYILILILFFSVQFGHGCNIGVAVSLKGDSKAMNLALCSSVMVGVCLGLPLTPWACRKFGSFKVCVVCMIIDLIVILLMLWPEITLQQIYAVRFLVGFFEAPLLPYLQEWLARFGKHAWNVWNTVLHAMVPLGENIGYIVAQELSAAGISWQWAFAGQAAALIVAIAALGCLLGRRYLDVNIGGKRSHTYLDKGWSGGGSKVGVESPVAGAGENDSTPLVQEKSFDTDLGDQEASYIEPEQRVEYPVTERWWVFWATNASLASQLGFLSGSKYVIRDYATARGFPLHAVLFTFSGIALIGPALGGIIAMSGSVVKPDKWSQHKKTLAFLTTVSMVAAGFALSLYVVPTLLFWPMLFLAFVSAGGVYPAAQGIINIALTETRVIEASVYQVQCNNLLIAMPMPYAIGKSMDVWGVDFSFKAVVMLQVVAAVGFFISLILAACTEERTLAWNRLSSVSRENSAASGDEGAIC